MDKERFACQVLALTDRMYRIAWTLLHNDADCRDAIQEAILHAWEKRPALPLDAVPEPAIPPPDPALEMVTPPMDRITDILHDEWTNQTKQQLSDLLRTYGISADLDTLTGQLDPSILQQEASLPPDQEALFALLYHHAKPEATDAETAQAYAAYILATDPPLDEHLVSEVMLSLIPREAWLYMDQEEDRGRCFARMTTEERAAFSAQWKPVVDALLSEHPAFDEYFRTHSHLDEAYTATRHVYGIPGVSGEMIDTRCRITALYDATDSPVWKVSIRYDAYSTDRWIETDHKEGFFVLIDPATGQVTQREQHRPDGGYTAYEYAEDFM